MQNSDRVSKGIADILDAQAEMRNILSVGKEAFLSDRKNSLAVKYLLIEAVEALADVCQHLLAKTKGVACSGSAISNDLAFFWTKPTVSAFTP